MKKKNFARISTPVSDVQLRLPIPEPEEIHQEDSIPAAISTSGIPEIQETTHQVPCGEHSIFDPNHKVSGFNRALYLVLNQRSTWDTGVTHALSLRRLAELLNIKSHSQVRRGLKWLIDNEWLMVEDQRKSDGANFYRVVHHKCDPSEMPIDSDGRPQKCAVPMGKGSPSRLLADGEITWRAFVDWIVRKIHSCWTTGVATMAVREACKLMKFTAKTIAENAKQMMEIGLLEQLSEKFRLSVYQLFPKPYPERRKRTDSFDWGLGKPMKLIKGWYYSYNERWRFHRETFRIKMRELCGRWRDSNLEELFDINPKIHRDFCHYMTVMSKFRGHTPQDCLS